MNESEKHKVRYLNIFYILIIVLLAIIATLLYQLNNKSFVTNKMLAKYIIAQNKKSPVDIKYGPNDIVIGQKDAPIDIFIYTSYRCTYCKDFFTTTFPELKKDFIDEGIAKLIIKNIAYTGDSISLLAAKTAYCAYAEGEFYDVHMKLLEQYNVLNEAVIMSWISELEIDSSQFTACLDNKILEDLIFENRKEARAIGARGTPAFVIGNSVFSGKRPISKFRELIEVELEMCE